MKVMDTAILILIETKLANNVVRAWFLMKGLSLAVSFILKLEKTMDNRHSHNKKVRKHSLFLLHHDNLALQETWALILFVQNLDNFIIVHALRVWKTSNKKTIWSN